MPRRGGGDRELRQSLLRSESASADVGAMLHAAYSTAPPEPSRVSFVGGSPRHQELHLFSTEFTTMQEEELTRPAPRRGHGEADEATARLRDTTHRDGNGKLLVRCSTLKFAERRQVWRGPFVF